MSILHFKPDQDELLLAGGLFLNEKPLRGPGWIWVRDGRIRALGADPPPTTFPGLTRDFTSLTLAPALIDAHVHLELLLKKSTTPDALLSLAATNGLGALRDGGGNTGQAAKLAGRAAYGPLIRYSGPALFKKGRYGGFIGQELSGREDMDQVAANLAAHGATQLKILASGPVDLDEYGRVDPPQFSREELGRIVRAARKHGLGVMAHANGEEAVGACLEAGVDSLEHGYFMGPDNLARLADSPCRWVPTMAPLAALLEQGGKPHPSSRTLWRIIEDQGRALALAAASGARLGLGSDAGAPGVELGRGLLSEMALFVAAGLSPSKVLDLATSSNARLVGLASLLGRLAPNLGAYIIGFETQAGIPGLFTHGPDLVCIPQV